jgi:Alpha-kinase family
VRADFGFNFPGSFYGKLVQLPGTHSLPFPTRCFIATRLLDGKVKKYTGNAEMGVPEDNLTKAVHAFTHFTYLYSHGHLVYCDLQGYPQLSLV